MPSGWHVSAVLFHIQRTKSVGAASQGVWSESHLHQLKSAPCYLVWDKLSYIQKKNPAEPKSKSNISIWEWEKKRIEIWSLWDVKSQLQDFKIRLTLIVPFAHLFFFLNTVLSVGYFPIWIHSFPSPAVSVCSCQVMTSPSFMSQNWSTAALLLLKKREEKKTSVFSS